MDKLIKGTQDRYNRKQLHGSAYARDFDTLVTQFDHFKLIGLSRGLYMNNPLVKAAIEQKGQYAIGNAFEYRNLSIDDTFKIKANNALKQWSKICEVSGMNLNDIAYLSSVKLDTDGEILILFTESDSGYPQLQFIEAHAIGSRQHGKIKNGKTIEEKGVIYDRKTKRPLSYRILGEKPEEDQIVSVRDIVRISEPSTNLRGLPLVTSCINMLYDLNQSQELLLTQHLLAASISMVEHNETGANEINLGDDTNVAEPFHYEVINNEGGEIRYLKSGSGKLEFLQNNNPSQNWKEYQDQLTNLAILALDWSKDLLGMSNGTGVHDRLSLAQCHKATVDRHLLLSGFFTRICNWALSKLIKNGFTDITKEEIPVDWYECSFTKPKSITVDFARDGKQILENYKAGITNLSDILDDQGIDYQTHIRLRFSEEALRKKIKAEVEAEYGVTLEDTDARLLSQNQFVTPNPNE